MPERVLIVEDEADISTIWNLKCEILGYDTTIVNNAKEAMIEIHKSEFSKVILDLVMPNGSGEEIWEELRLNHPNTSVLVISGHDLRRDCLEKLGARCLRKPCTFEEFEEAITQI